MHSLAFSMKSALQATRKKSLSSIWGEREGERKGGGREKIESENGTKYYIYYVQIHFESASECEYAMRKYKILCLIKKVSRLCYTFPMPNLR